MTWTRENPGAGEPWGIRNQATLRTNRADDLRVVQGTLGAVRNDAGSADWTAKSRDAFVANLDALGPSLVLLIQGLDAHAAALQRYATEIEQIQDQQSVLGHQRSDAQDQLVKHERQRSTLLAGMELWATEPSHSVDSARLDRVIDADQTMLRGCDAQWEDLIAHRRSADSTCAQQLGSVQALGPLAAFTATAIRFDSSTELLSRFATLSAADLQVLVGLHPDLAGRFTAHPPSAQMVAEWWSALGHDQQLALAAGVPEVVGALDGVPWEVRFSANRTNIAAAQDDEAAVIAGLREEITTLQAHPNRGDSQAGMALAAALGEALARAKTLREMGSSDRQVLLFDPTGNGRYAEVHGTLSAETSNVGIIVNGTTLAMDTVLMYDERAKGFYDASVTRQEDVVTITWMGTDFPGWDTYVTGDIEGMAEDGGARLAEFVTGVDEVVTVAGQEPPRIGVFLHSAGGLIGGSAEKIGLPADYVVHIESAGAGPDVSAVDDYAQPNKERFVMTAPGDFIQLTQGGFTNMGVDPDRLAGITVLDSGREGLIDPAAHDGVFEPGSEAWEELYGVLTTDGRH